MSRITKFSLVHAATAKKA